MNPIDILGGMLGRKSGGGSSGGGGIGGAILESILKGKKRGGPSSRQAEAPLQRPAGSPQIRPRSNAEEFDSLEDLLRHGHKSYQQRQQPQQRQQQPTQAERFPQADEQIHRRQTDFSKRLDRDPSPFNANAKMLVVAMINAAKSDGQIDQKEQDAIVNELGDLSQEEVQFLRAEFAKPLDVKEFAWSVPLGMERQVYAVSLIAIDLDRNAEADYLRQLAHGFRMSQQDCNQIHREFNAPEI